MLRVRLTKRAILFHAVLPILAACYLTWMPWNEPLFAEATYSYINFDSSHALGYPFFLQIMDMVSQDRFSVVYFQIWFFTFAVFYLSLSIRKNTDNHFFGVLIAIPILCNPIVLATHFTLLPDSLFISFSILAMGFLISAFGYARFINLLGAGLSIGFCITLCPQGWAYTLLIILAAPLMKRRNHCSLTKAFMIPAVACATLVLFEASTYKAIHDAPAARAAAEHIFAGAALMKSNQPTPYAEKDPRTKVWHMIEEDLEGARNDIWNATQFSERKGLLSQKEAQLRGGFADAALLEASQLLAKSINDVRMDIASARIVQDPLAFLQISTDHYRSLWASHTPYTYAVWAITFLCCFFGFWHFLKGEVFNPLFAGCFVSALAIHFLTVWVAHTGLGPQNVVILLSPLITICFTCILLGFYTSFINPIRNDA